MKFKKCICSLLILFVSINAFSKTALELFNEAYECQEKEDWYGAVELYNLCLEQNKQYSDAWYNLAVCNYNLENYNLAIEYAKNAAKYSKNSQKIMNLMGMSYIALGQTDQARKIFEEVLKIYPNDIDSRFGLAELDLLDGKITSAKGLYEQALVRDNKNKKALLSLAIVSAQTGKYDLCRNYINQALIYHSGDKEVHYLAAFLCCLDKDLDEAEKRARSAVQLDGEYDKAYALLSQILYEKKQYNEVIDICEFRTSRNRELSDAWYLMALCYEKIGNREEAMDCYATGLNMNPEDEIMRLSYEQLVSSSTSIENPIRKTLASYHVQKAEEYNRNYDGQSQRYELQKALALNPLDLSVRQMFAKMLEREGMYEFYLQQLKFISENLADSKEINSKRVNENSPSMIKSQEKQENDDKIEALESMLKSSLSNKWGVESFYLDKTRWNIGIYYVKSPIQMVHSDLEKTVAFACKDIFNGVSSTSVNVLSKDIENYAEAYRNARETKRDYFIIVDTNETERTFSIDAKVYSARTGTLTTDIHIYRTGNDKVAKALRRFRQSVVDILPIRGKVIKNSQGKLLVDLGKNDGVYSGSEFDIVKRGTIYTNDVGPGISYKEENIIGKFRISVAGEEISEGDYVKKGFYDTLNVGDEVVLVKAQVSSKEEGNISTDTRPQADNNGNPVTLEALKAEKEDITKELKAHVEENQFVKLIQEIME